LARAAWPTADQSSEAGADLTELHVGVEADCRQHDEQDAGLDHHSVQHVGKVVCEVVDGGDDDGRRAAEIDHRESAHEDRVVALVGGQRVALGVRIEADRAQELRGLRVGEEIEHVVLLPHVDAAIDGTLDAL
jgi:hypothetical protein